MADLKNLKRSATPSKQKINSKLQGINPKEGSEIMSRSGDTNRSVKPKDLNFKIDPEFHSRFKKFATNHDMSMKDLLERCFTFYAEAHEK